MRTKAINQADLAWFAGLYEGEGHCEFWYRRGSHSTALVIGMTDRDVLERVQHVTGVGFVYDRPQPEHGKQMFHWKVHRREQIAFLIRGMLPYLGKRRIQQLAPLLNFCDTALVRRRPTREGYVELSIKEEAV